MRSYNAKKIPVVKCAIYARYSSNNQNDCSIEDQIKTCRKYAASKGWSVLNKYIYSDHAVSGRSIALRKDFLKLKKIALSGEAEFNKILIYDASRFARNFYEFIVELGALSKEDISVCMVSQNYDTVDKQAKIGIVIAALMADLYIDSLSASTRRGLVGRIENGYFAGGKRIYGYKIIKGSKNEGKKLEIDQDENLVVERIFKMFGEKLYSTKKIASILNKELKETGEPAAPSKGKWSPGKIKTILRNSIYIGEYVWGKKKLKRIDDGKKIFVESDEPVCHVNPGLRIVTDKLWNKVSKRQSEVSIKVNRRKYPSEVKAHFSEHLLTGLAVCNGCGGNIVIVRNWGKGKIVQYGCCNNRKYGDSGCSNGNHEDGGTLESSVILKLNNELRNDSSLPEMVIAHIKESQTRHFSDKERLEKELKETEEAETNIHAAIERGFSHSSTIEYYNKTLEKHDELKDKLVSMNSLKLKDTQVSRGDVEKALDKILKIIAGGDETLNPKALIGRMLNELRISPKVGKGLNVALSINIDKLSDLIMEFV